jgi:hypothetical protein
LVELDLRERNRRRGQREDEPGRDRNVARR